MSHYLDGLCPDCGHLVHRRWCPRARASRKAAPPEGQLGLGIADIPAAPEPEPPPPHVTGSRTSKAAAERIDGPARITAREKVFSAIAGAGVRGMTRPEIAHTLGMSENTVRPRVVELMALDARRPMSSPRIEEHPEKLERDGCLVLVTRHNAAIIRGAPG